jgi:hypothetical protein
MDTSPTPADLDDTPTLDLSWDEIVARWKRSKARARGGPDRRTQRPRDARGGLSRPPRSTDAREAPGALVASPRRQRNEPGDVEDTRTHLHRRRFRGSVANPGRTILHIIQGPLIVNVRGL